MHPTAERFQTRLRELGLDAEVRELADSTRTAQEAADAIGVEVGQIVKSLMFVDQESPLLCLCAGDRRVDTEKLGAGARQAKGDEVREATGFAIGGVPPFGHATPLRIFIDEDLLAFDAVWAAAGTWNDVFALTPDDLVRASGGTVTDLRR